MISLFRRQPIAALLSATRPMSTSRRTVIRIVALILTLYVAGSLLIVLSTQRAADALLETDISSTLTGGEIELTKFENKLSTFDYRLRRTKVWLFPVRQGARLFSFIGFVERQRSAAELLLQRVEIDSEAANAAIELGRSTLVLRDTALSGSTSFDDAGAISGLRESLGILKSDSSRVLMNLELTSTIGSRFDELGVAGPIGSLHERLTTQEGRLRQIAEFSLILSEVLLADLELMAKMNSTFDELKAFVVGEINIRELSYVIDDLVNETQAIRDKAVKMTVIAPSSVMESDFGDIVLSLRDLNVSAHGLMTGINTILEAAVSPFDLLSSTAGTLFEDGEAITGAIQVLIEMEEELSSSSQLIIESIEVLQGVGETGPISLGSRSEVLGELTAPLLNLSAVLESAPRVAAEVFAIDGTTSRYLVLGQTSDELRAAGGFTSSAWLMTFRGGALISNEFLEITLLEDAVLLGEYPEAFEELQLHMDAGRMYMRDVGWSPHFPAVGKLAADIYEIGQVTRVDGVISLTQWAFIDLVSALDGIETESGTVSSTELLSVIEKGTDRQGTGYLATLFDSLMDSLSGEKIRTHGVDLLIAIMSSFENKGLMIYSKDPAVQRLISDIGWDGGLSNSPRDRLVIIDSNVGWNKVDRNIARTFTYELDLTDLAEPRAKLSLGYANSSLSGDNCELQSLKGRTYQEFLHGCYWNYFRVYVPLGAELVGGDDLPLEKGSIAARVGGLPVGTRTVRQLFDDDGNYISGLLTVNPQNSANVILSYTLPSQIIIRDGQFVEYALDVVSQAGTRGRTGSIVVKLPAGYEVVEVKPTASILSNDLTVIDLVLTKDEAIRVKIRKSSQSVISRSVE